jgi:mono/diheme cytochrome c family protein
MTSLARSLTVGCSLLALSALAACGGGEAQKPETPPPLPAAAPVEPAPMAEPTEATPPAGAATAPAASAFPCIAGDPAAGKAKYAQLCASCHGATGGGDGIAAAGLDPKPAHHNDGNYMNPLSNDHLTKVITSGGASVGKSALMAPWGSVLGPQGVQDVIAYVRTLANPPYACP